MTPLTHARFDMIMPRARCVGLRRRRNPYRRGVPVQLHPLIGRSGRIASVRTNLQRDRSTAAGLFTVRARPGGALTVARSSAAAAWRVLHELA